MLAYVRCMAIPFLRPSAFIQPINEAGVQLYAVVKVSIIKTISVSQNKLQAVFSPALASYTDYHRPAFQHLSILNKAHGLA